MTVLTTGTWLTDITIMHSLWLPARHRVKSAFLSPLDHLHSEVEFSLYKPIQPWYWEKFCDVFVTVTRSSWFCRQVALAVSQFSFLEYRWKLLALRSAAPGGSSSSSSRGTRTLMILMLRAGWILLTCRDGNIPSKVCMHAFRIPTKSVWIKMSKPARDSVQTIQRYCLRCGYYISLTQENGLRKFWNSQKKCFR